MNLKKILLPLLLITAIATTPMATSCNGEAAAGIGYGMLGTILVVGIVLILWGGDEATVDLTPVDPVQLSLSMPIGTLPGDFITRGEKDWYSIPIEQAGDVITVWSESDEGVMAILVDEFGNYGKSDNGNEPGSNFRIELHATEPGTVYLMLYGIADYPPTHKDESREYTLNWMLVHGG